ncbi:MAG: F0F1 ATP synthase subunit alpha, partial [Muribaculaceae bacterium]|nr:F0F1 ATP synthase subunit alpha [Muribaculaceae bacterium]
VIDKGRKNERLLIQPQYHPVAVEDEVALIFCGINGLLENVPVDKVAEFEKQLLQLLGAKYKEDVLEPIRAGKLTDDVAAKLTEAANQIAGPF